MISRWYDYLCTVIILHFRDLAAASLHTPGLTKELEEAKTPLGKSFYWYKYTYE